MEIWEQPDDVRIAAARKRWLGELRFQQGPQVSRLWDEAATDRTPASAESPRDPRRVLAPAA
jgi:hypothetical protein